MPNVPIRDLGAVGVITDQDPFTLPINAFTRAKNVRFDQGTVHRSPGFREVVDFYMSGMDAGTTPRDVFSTYNPGGFDQIYMIDTTFDVYEYSNGSISKVLNTTLSASETSVTGSQLANVTYLNRVDAAPYHRKPADSLFTTLPNWDAGWRAGSLRSFGDFLIALNLTESGTEYPTRVRFSDIALANNPPSSWDATDTTKSAGFNDLVQMTTPIIDGATLGNNFLIYSSDQVWSMDFVGGTFIFNFRKRFDDAGVISQNCILEVNGKHYVFDNDDIYVTDGLSKQSIADGRVRDYIFAGLDNSNKDMCFVQYDPTRDDVYFCYNSDDDMAVFTGQSGCNRAAVYNIPSNTWSFADLPNVVGGANANVSTSSTYASTSLTYSTAGGTYVSQAAGYDRHTLMFGRLMTSEGITDHKLFVLDGIDENSKVSRPLNTVATKPIRLERVGIDLDELQVPISGYKNIRKMMPQFSTVAVDKTFDVTMGAADLPNSAPNYGSTYSFNSGTEHKIDARSAGRYLSYKIGSQTEKDFDLSGFDFDLVTTGRR
jgi:hypothetical protein